MSKLHESVDYNNLTFEYILEYPTEDVSFYEYMDFKELSNKLKDYRIRFDVAKKKEKDLLDKLKEVILGKKNPKQKEMINNLANFYKSREEVLNFVKDYSKIFFDAS